MSDDADAVVPDQALRSVLDFAVSMSAAASRQRPVQPFPVELKRFWRATNLTPAALARVRGAVEADDGFRKHLASVATPELVDEIGMLWLERPTGWADAIATLLPPAPVDAESASRREERRRQHAEARAERAVAEGRALLADLDKARAAQAALVTEGDRLRHEIDDLRQRLRDAQRHEHATAQALAKAEAELVEARQAVLDIPPATPPAPALDTAALRTMVAGAIAASTEAAHLLGSALDELAALDVEPAEAGSEDEQPRRPRRSSLKLPGGVLVGSIESADFLLHVPGVRILVDGYNVAKLGWPAFELDRQRDQCVQAAENLAKRWKVDITIVFDGAAIEGAHASSRKRLRVVYSPAGVSADDVLRAEVASTPDTVPVVVVTNDRAIVTDVVAAGANTVSSDLFLALVR